jgi:transmembrane sensor
MKFNELNDDKLFGLFTQLQIPPSEIDKGAAWENVLKRVKNEQRWERFRIGFVRWGAAAVVLIIILSIILEWQLSVKSYKTPFGKIAYIQLPDSSRVTLNAGSTIEHFEFGFNRKRIVKLNGEALFDVKSGNSEFVVFAGNHTVKVVGTRFNVLFRNNYLEVKCISGIVEVKVNDLQTETLRFAEGISILPNSSEYSIWKVDVFKAISWTNGEFFYSEIPLNLVFEEVMRQFNIRIEYEGFNPNNWLYSGYFTNNNVNIALDLICIPAGLKHEYDSKNNVFRIYQKNY